MFALENSNEKKIVDLQEIIDAQQKALEESVRQLQFLQNKSVNRPVTEIDIEIKKNLEQRRKYNEAIAQRNLGRKKGVKFGVQN